MTPPTQSALRQTTRLDEANVAIDQPVRLLPPLAFTAPSAPWNLIVQIGEEYNSALRVEFLTQLTIGRADLPDGYVPELDLTAYGATDGGVSRRHALIYATDGKLYVRDLCSTNGTRLNGKMLTPNQAYSLREGDIVEFGRLRLKLNMVRAPR